MSLFGEDSDYYKKKYGEARTAPRKFEVFPSGYNYRKLLGGLQRGFGEQYAAGLLPGLGAAAARQAMLRGSVINPMLADIPASADVLALMNSADIADQLQGLRTVIAGQIQGVPTAGSSKTDILTGAAEGFGAGGPFGAIAGSGAGALESSAKTQARSNTLRNIDRAIEFTSPERTAETFMDIQPTARELSLASGQGQRRAQSIEAAITASGLRGTGLGALASVAAGAQVDLAGLETAVNMTRDIQQRQVSHVLGTPVKESRDPITRALEGLANAVIGFGQTRNQPTQATRVPENTGFGSAPLLPSAYDPGYTPPQERAGVNI